jgi:hypothetical protein
MNNPDIATYIKEAEIIEKMYVNLLNGTTQRRMKHIDDGSTGLPNVEYRICVLNSKNEVLQSSLLQRYGAWYESCRELVQEYVGTSRTSKDEDIAGLHEKIVGLIDLHDSVSNSNEKKHLRKEFIACFDAQVRILHSAGSRIALAKNNHERMVTADLINSELDEAEGLCELGSVCSAGTVAGEALERYLRMLCGVNGVEPEPEEAVAAIVQRLYDSDEAKGFDSDKLVTMEYLVTLSERCAITDEAEGPHEEEVRELIDRIREMVFLAFC